MATLKVAHANQQLEWSKRQLFGRKSERHLPPYPNQGNLLADLLADLAPAPMDDVVHDSGLRFDETVPVQVIERPAPELQGPEADAFEIIGEKITHRLAQRPGVYVILEYHRPVLKRCGTEQLSTTPAPPNVLDRSFADERPFALLPDPAYLFPYRAPRQ